MEVENRPRVPRGSNTTKITGRGGSPKNGLESAVGYWKGVGCVSRKEGCCALQEAGRGALDKSVSHCWGLVWGNHTPRGCWCVLGSGSSSRGSRISKRSNYSQAWERRQHRQGRGLGLWKDKVQQDPGALSPGWDRAPGLDQGRARTAMLVDPSHSPQGQPHLCPHCSSGNSGGAGGAKHRSSCPPLQSCLSSTPPLALSPPL